MNSEGVGLIVREISFQDFQPMWSWFTNVTDGQRDDMRSRNTALCTIVHRAVKTPTVGLLILSAATCKRRLNAYFIVGYKQHTKLQRLPAIKLVNSVVNRAFKTFKWKTLRSDCILFICNFYSPVNCRHWFAYRYDTWCPIFCFDWFDFCCGPPILSLRTPDLHAVITAGCYIKCNTGEVDVN